MTQETPGAGNEWLNAGSPTLNEPGAPIEPEPHSQHPFGQLHSSEAAKMATWAREDLASGKITHEQASKIWDDLGTPLEQRQPDTRSDEVRQLDKAFPPATGKDYVLRFNPPGDSTPLNAEQKVLDTDARTWLQAGGFDREMGTSFAKILDETSVQTNKMTDQQRELYGLAEAAKLERLYGPDTLAKKYDQARRFLADVEQVRPGLLAMIRAGGAFDSALIVNMIFQQAERYWMRKGHKG